MEVTIKTAYDKGDRVWMPDGNGHQIKGRVVKITLFDADITERHGKMIFQSLNYHCIDERNEIHVYHEHQLKPRNVQ